MNSPVMGPASCHYACSNSNSERKSRGSEYLGEEHGAPNEQKHSKKPPHEPKGHSDGRVEGTRPANTYRTIPAFRQLSLQHLLSRQSALVNYTKVVGFLRAAAAFHCDRLRGKKVFCGMHRAHHRRDVDELRSEMNADVAGRASSHQRSDDVARLEIHSSTCHLFITKTRHMRV